ncbi:MAG: SUMF1/EgtB/PvdO family nonheme iron enzyme, partial [Fimbriimonadaceae bacterium]|nr:SUMF1/EgtB/PvdO family nonheme iron enzyme [Chitinophagales bacterium]
MKIFTTSVLLLIVICFSCSPKFDVVRKEISNGNNPPNCVWLKDNLHIDQSEVSNTDYREYIYWLLRHYGSQSDQHKKSLPNTVVWRQITPFYPAYEEYYLWYPSYGNYPVVGITKDQAENYCRWRSYSINKFIYAQENKVKKISFFEDTTFKSNFPIKYIYRLPTKKEWEYAATAGTKSEIGYENILTDKNEYKINTKETFTLKSYSIIETKLKNNDVPTYVYNTSYTLPIYSSEPNKYWLYNMIGNVAELVQEEGIAKGGSFYHYLDSCKISVDIPYTEP